ncbi:MAG: molybdopterin synthase sulfur carrier subunit [Thermoproteota archaeon]|mgnify:CR=1 FL=1|nr:MAG: molybdopterin synthase sulfur carrier subunit [Candidatus Korarchaeota archaeon]RLG55456.1 MAG: molybdopterin synthase sulfur carrier subunit [Candidatus Korarchaeota archaeon]
MRVKVKLFATLRESTGVSQLDLELTGSKVADVIYTLVDMYPQLSSMLDSNGKLKKFYKVFLNGRDIDHIKGLDSPIKEGDVLAIFPPVAGG